MTAARDLARDERGTVLAVGIFASVFLFGAVFYLLGIGEAVDHRQTMQNAADSGAYSMAALHAHAMNLIAMLNMVKLSIAAVLTSLMAIMFAATETIAWISSNQFRLIALGAAIPVLAAIDVQTITKFASIRGDAQAVLRAADRAQETLRDRLPEVAEAQAGQAIRVYGEPVERGMSPLRKLPVRRGTTAELCIRALPFARPIALDAFDPVPLPPAKSHARQQADLALMPSCLSLGVAAMELEPGTALGGDRLQLRYYVTGAPLPGRGQAGVEVAAYGKKGDPADEGGVSFAQAEYYFDGVGAAAQPLADDLFTVGWRARFRRVRTPNLAAEVNAACGQGAAGCGETAARLRDQAGRVAH